MTFESTRDAEDGVRVVRAGGELDASRAPARLGEMQALVEGASGLVLDLSAVAFFDSAGVRLVDRVARECAKTGAPLRVVAPPDTPARRVLDLVGMTPGLVEPDVGAALEAIRAR